MAANNAAANVPSSFRGYRRDNGRVGIRNHVLILPLDDISNAACEAVANNIKGTLAIPHAYGRLQFGADLELYFRTIIGTGSNPNVAACVVIGIEPGWTARVVDVAAHQGQHRRRPFGAYQFPSQGATSRGRATLSPTAAWLARARCRIVHRGSAKVWGRDTWVHSEQD